MDLPSPPVYLWIGYPAQNPSFFKPVSRVEEMDKTSPEAPDKHKSSTESSKSINFQPWKFSESVFASHLKTHRNDLEGASGSGRQTYSKYCLTSWGYMQQQSTITTTHRQGVEKPQTLTINGCMYEGAWCCCVGLGGNESFVCRIFSKLVKHTRTLREMLVSTTENSKLRSETTRTNET